MNARWKKNISVSLYGGLISAACTAAIAVALVPADLKTVLVSSLISILPGAVIGELVALIMEFSSRLEDSTKILGEIRSTWPYHEKFEHALGVHKKHRRFTEQLIRLSVVEKIWQIPDVSAESFYRMLIDALAHCEVWEGIHHGSIKKLGHEPSLGQHARMGQEYFKALTEAVTRRKVEARRIIILSDDDQKELEDQEIMRAFWEKTGSKVRSFWISEDVVKRNIEKLGMLDDSALHDHELFLQYDRTRELVRFEADEKMRWVKDMFEKLDLYIKGNPNLLGFKEFTEDALVHSTTSSREPIK